MSHDTEVIEGVICLVSDTLRDRGMMAISTTGPHMRKRSVLRLAAAGMVTLLAGLFAAVFWILARAQYITDYCFTRAPQPEAPNPEAISGRPAYLDGPFTVVCEYDRYPTVEVIDPLPFVGALVLAAVVVGIGVGTFRWAWRPKQPKRSDSPAERPAST